VNWEGCRRKWLKCSEEVWCPAGKTVPFEFHVAIGNTGSMTISTERSPSLETNARPGNQRIVPSSRNEKNY
jgi:hypothetical protein